MHSFGGFSGIKPHQLYQRHDSELREAVLGRLYHGDDLDAVDRPWLCKAGKCKPNKRGRCWVDDEIGVFGMLKHAPRFAGQAARGSSEAEQWNPLASLLKLLLRSSLLTPRLHHLQLFSHQVLLQRSSIHLPKMVKAGKSPRL
jgi:hypothetical protein